jgi:hypothetical protein
MATTNYPGSLDAYPVPNNGDTISVADHWLGPAVIGIETELGTDPAGYATDVKTRLDDINPSEGNLNLDAGYGSKAPIYGVRAWVNFNGTGTVAIRESANVSSVTDNATGDYTVNFTSAMPDANYCVLFSTGGQETTSTANRDLNRGASPTVGAVRALYSNGNQDTTYAYVAILR